MAGKFYVNVRSTGHAKIKAKLTALVSSTAMLKK